MRAVQVPYFHFAFALNDRFKEERKREDESDEQRAEQVLQSRPGRVDELPGDQVLQRLAGGAKSMPSNYNKIQLFVIGLKIQTSYLAFILNYCDLKRKKL